jgi:DNA repair protein SbcC/Rad50
VGEAMFLKEFAIRRYGPLPDSGKIKPGRFNLFFGPNEDGKTLTIDALLKLLFGRGAASCFSGVTRVDENPEGYLIVDHDREIKLPENGTLTDLLGFSASEFGRVFVIRDSDLVIDKEGDFYRSMTARLTGIRTAEIEKIIYKIRDIGRVTPGGSFQNTEPYKFKDRYYRAEALLERVEPLPGRLNDEGFNSIEEELARLAEERKVSSEKLSHYSAARMRELYEKGCEALKRLTSARAEADNLSQYNQDDYERWHKALTALAYLRAERKRLDDGIKRTVTEISSVRSSCNELELENKKLERILNNASKSLPRLLEQGEGQQVKLKQLKSLVGGRVISIFSLIALVSFFISLVGIIIKSHWLLHLVAGLSFFTLLALVIVHLVLKIRQARYSALHEVICLEAEKLGFKAESVGSVRSAYGALERDYAEAVERLARAAEDAAWLQKDYERLRTELELNRQSVSREEEKITSISRTFAVATAEEFKALLDRKSKMESEIRNQQNMLKSHFDSGTGYIPVEPDIAYWEEKVEALNIYSDAAPGLRYEQKIVDYLKETLRAQELKADELKNLLAGQVQELRDLEKDFNELMRFEGEDYLPCQTSLDLEVLIDKLKEWIESHRQKVAGARLAIEIFEELKAEEEAKVTTLFGYDSAVSLNFKQMTGGRYVSVYFRGGEYPITVETVCGKELKASQLSGGTYDQLYFSIRLALGEKLLKGGRGFFILDDPFIKADSERLLSMLGVLDRICDEGWQIFYFSAKDEVKELLSGKIAAGKVKEYNVGLRQSYPA